MAKTLKVTPVGIAVWPHLHAPDTKFDADGVLHTKLKLSGADAETLKSEIDAAIDAAVRERQSKDPKKKIKRADAPYKPETDNDGNETGATIFTFKVNAKGKRQDGTEFKNNVGLYDSKMKPLVGVRIGGGSEIRVSYEMSAYKNYTPTIGQGVSLRLKGVQVVTLREFGGDAASLGFGVIDGGYEGAEETATGGEEFTPPAAPSATSTEPQSASDF